MTNRLRFDKSLCFYQRHKQTQALQRLSEGGTITRPHWSLNVSFIQDCCLTAAAFMSLDGTCRFGDLLCFCEREERTNNDGHCPVWEENSFLGPEDIYRVRATTTKREHSGTEVGFLQPLENTRLWRLMKTGGYCSCNLQCFSFFIFFSFSTT